MLPKQEAMQLASLEAQANQPARQVEQRGTEQPHRNLIHVQE